MNDGDGAEEEVGDVSEDGGATGGDEIRGEKFVEFGGGIVNAQGSGEFVAIGCELLEEVGGRFMAGRDLACLGQGPSFRSRASARQRRPAGAR